MSISPRSGLRLSLGLFFFVFDLTAASAQNFPQVRVTASSLRVRNMDGVHVCSLPNGTRVQPVARDANSEKIQIRPGTANCPATGIVDADYVDFDDDSDSEVQVTRQGTNFRSRASLSGDTVQCQLPAGTRLNLQSEEPISNKVAFYKVRLASAKPGCPRDGYVAASLLEPSDPYEKLPEYGTPDPRRRSEAESCTDCERANGGLREEGRQIQRAIRRGDEQTQIARALTKAAQDGRGHVGRNLCYRAVKRIIAAARIPGIDVSKIQGGSAVDAMQALPRAGFTNTFPTGCTVPGAILVYEGSANHLLSAYRNSAGKRRAAIKAQARSYVLQKFGRRYTEGDLHGHIEILGTDGKYHHFVSSRNPISSTFGRDRRKLKGCFLKQ